MIGLAFDGIPSFRSITLPVAAWWPGSHDPRHHKNGQKQMEKLISYFGFNIFSGAGIGLKKTESKTNEDIRKYGNR